MKRDSDNPYAAPHAKVGDRRRPRPQGEEGSYGFGLFLGFLLGLWGMLGCVVFAKPETKRGSVHGFLARLLFALIVIGIALAMG